MTNLISFDGFDNSEIPKTQITQSKSEFVVSASIQLCAAILIQGRYQHNSEYIPDDAIIYAEKLWEELVSRGYLSPDRSD